MLVNSVALRFMPEEERPRERLLREGVEALSLSELIAIVLETGTRGKSALALAQELVNHFKSLNGILEASVQELMQIKGIGRVKAIKLRAIFGIAMRNRRPPFSEREKIQTPEEAFHLARSEIAHEKREVLLVILRNVKGGLIHFEKVSVGTLSEVLVHPREVFYPAVRHKAHSLIIAHNHPSGDPTPSKADLELTRLLSNSSRVMGISLDDHLIVTPEAFTSLRERGYLGPQKHY
jgi:DNA repair protein RadC